VDILQLCEQYIKDFNIEDELKKTDADLDNLSKVTVVHSRLVVLDYSVIILLNVWSLCVYTHQIVILDVTHSLKFLSIY